MKSKLYRDLVQNNPNRTTGKLFVNGKFQCFTLEDVTRGLKSDMSLADIRKIKVYGKTAIPTGIYKVVKHMWEKHKRDVPHITNVPGYSGIFIHSGVTENDSLGCVLVGTSFFERGLANSKNARIALDKVIFDAIDAGEEVTIEIVEGEEAPKIKAKAEKPEDVTTV